MKKQIIALTIIALLLTACVSTRNSASSEAPLEVVSDVIAERSYDYQAVQVAQGDILPPYGIKVKAEIVELTLSLKTSQKEPLDRIPDLQNAISELKAAAAKTETISVGEISIGQVNSSYLRSGSETSNVQNMDTSFVTLKLTTNLSAHDNDYIKCVAAFNDFLNTVNLPETIDAKTISVESKLDDLEPYRSQIIDMVYQEIDAAQQTYGEAINFNISGLYSPLSKMRLSDTEYYIYLDPTVTVNEF